MNDEAHLKSLLRALSHDLRGSLGATATLAGMLKESYANQLDERGIKWLNLMAKEYSTSKVKLIGLSSYAQLFDYQTTNTQCSLAQLVERSFSETKSTQIDNKPSSIELETHGLTSISTDETLMTHYIGELLLNSYKHAKPHKNDESLSTIKCKLTFSAFDEESYSLVYEDNGRSLDASDIDYILQPLQTLKSSRQSVKSAGLGLSRVSRIAELLNTNLLFELGAEPFGGLRIKMTTKAS
jgi:light-regulated signal transduction histidine kinase (bacteriophytochrome)